MSNRPRAPRPSSRPASSASSRQIATTRRGFLTAGAVGAFTAAFASPADAQAPGAVEQRNIAVVNAMCQSWKSSQVEAIAAFMTDDLKFRGSADRMEAPPTQTKQAFIDTIRRFLTTASIEMVIHDTFARGSVVVNIHQQLFDVKGEGLREDWYIGVFHLVDGKIREWNDYAIIPFSAPREPRGANFGRFVRA
jgi:limonene-1,2-epoxide hydrolase